MHNSRQTESVRPELVEGQSDFDKLTPNGVIYIGKINSVMDVTAIKRPLIISAVLAGIVAACAWYYDAMPLALLCMLVAAWQLVRGLYYALRRNRDGLKVSGLRFLMWAAALASAIVAHNYYAKLTRERGDALVVALQAYRAREGRYPQNLEALAQREIAAVPGVALNPYSKQKFRYRSEANTFQLSYRNFCLL